MKLLELADKLKTTALNAGIKFNAEGYPIFPKSFLLDEEPDYMIPMRQRYAVKDKKKTVLLSFDTDRYIYKRLQNLDRDMGIYTSVLGVGGFDLSPRVNWDVSQQKLNILLNLLADIYLGLHGVKLLPNFRTGCSATFSSLNVYPPGTNYAVGLLGCARGNVALNTMYLRSKILMARPNKLLCYGTLRAEYAAILQEYHIPYRVFLDFKQTCFRKGA